MTAPHAHHVPVLIVGGGITGLSAALFLARHGIRPTLIERHPTTALVPQARAFNPRSMEIYRALGLEQEILEHQSMLVDFPEMMGAETLAGDERFRLDVLAQVRPPASVSPADWAMIDQDELERLVRAHAENDGADIRFGTELIACATEADGVTATVRDLATGAESRIHADYLIAADGHRAGIRSRLGIGADGPGVLMHVVYFIFDADLTAALRGRRFMLGYLDQPTMGTALVPLRTFGRWLLGVPYDPENNGGLGEFTERRCVELARLAVGDPDLEVELVAQVPGLPHKISDSTIGGWVADRYRHGRIFFAGDAAHVVPPSGSYGANTGIADAHNLAWKLAAVLKKQATPQLLDTYDEERRPVAQLTLQTAMQLLEDRHQGGGDDATKTDNITMIFGYRYDSAAIRTENRTPADPLADPRTPSGRPGLRAPHVWLERAGARVSTIDLFDGSFTLLVGPDGTDWIAAAKAVAAALEIQLSIHHIGVDLQDPAARLLDSYGITGTGVSLIRPDGFVAWRADSLAQQPEHELRQVLTYLLSGTGQVALLP